MAHVDVQDVLKRWKDTNQKPDADDQVLLTLIEDAEDHIHFTFPSIWERLDSGELPEQRLKRVVAAVVQRAYMDNGENRSFFSETVGAFSQSATLKQGEGSGIYLTAEEMGLLSSHRKGHMRAVSLFGGRPPARRWDWDCYD